MLERDRALHVLGQSEVIQESENIDKAHRASREFCRPVPDIRTSHFVSLKDSIMLSRNRNAIWIRLEIIPPSFLAWR